jgi:peptide/nickel transport system permease protein
MTEQRKIFWFILRRSIEGLFTVLLIVTLCFFLVHAAPGDPVIYMVGETAASEEWMNLMRTRLGLDKPLYEQYLIYIRNLLKGDFGYSYIRNTKVLDILLHRLPATMLLVATAIITFSTLGTFFGVFASTKPGRFQDNVLTAIALFGFCIPNFFLGLTLMYIFSLKLGWFPVAGMYNIGKELRGLDYVIDVIRHLFLPALVLGGSSFALIYRTMRQSMLEALQEDFIITARSKGLSEKAVLFKHALKNSLRPLITLLGLRGGMIVGGAVITETVFSWPGIGRLLYEATMTRDYPLLLGGFTLTAISVVTANLVVDLVYGIIDPRVRYR